MQITITKRFEPKGNGPVAVLDQNETRYKFWPTTKPGNKPNPVSAVCSVGATVEITTSTKANPGYPDDTYIETAVPVGGGNQAPAGGGGYSAPGNRDSIIIAQVAVKGAVDLAAHGQIPVDEIGIHAGKIQKAIYTLAELGSDPFAD